MLRGRSLGQAIGVVALVCATFGVSTASAQVDYEIMASLQFNFSNPGARSLAMAGALTGAGDDATGAWTNPGGLTNITRPEVGVEFRGFDFSTPFVSAGHFPGQPTASASTPSLAASTASPRTRRTACRSSRRWCPKSRFAFAFYRTEVANFETNISTDRHVLRRPGRRHACRAPFRIDGTLELQIANFGGSVAVRSDGPVLGRRRRLVLRLRHSLGRRPLRRLRPRTAAGQLRRPAAADRPTTSCRDEFIDAARTRRAFGVNVGASINPNDTLRIGASYRQGPKFDMRLPSRRLLRRLIRRRRQHVQGARRASRVGVLVKPIPQLNIAVDYRRVAVLAVDQRHEARVRHPDDDFIVSVDDYVARRRQRVPRRRRVPVHRTCRRRCPPSPSAAASGTTPITASGTRARSQTDTVLYPAGDSRDALHRRRRHRVREVPVRRRIRSLRDGEDVLGVGGASASSAGGAGHVRLSGGRRGARVSCS